MTKGSLLTKGDIAELGNVDNISFSIISSSIFSEVNKYVFAIHVNVFNVRSAMPV